MRVLRACRYALLLVSVAYLVTLLLGVAGAISAEAALLFGVLTGCGIGVAALLCVAVQIGITISRKRHLEHG